MRSRLGWVAAGAALALATAAGPAHAGGTGGWTSTWHSSSGGGHSQGGHSTSGGWSPGHQPPNGGQPAPRGGGTPVPEPADFLLFAAGVAGLLIGRRSSRRLD